MAKLSHKNLDDLQSGFRSLQVSGEDQKEDPLDFCSLETEERGRTILAFTWCDGVRDGILSVLLWRKNTLVMRLISMQAEKT